VSSSLARSCQRLPVNDRVLKGPRTAKPRHVPDRATCARRPCRRGLAPDRVDSLSRAALYEIRVFSMKAKRARRIVGGGLRLWGHCASTLYLLSKCGSPVPLAEPRKVKRDARLRPMAVVGAAIPWSCLDVPCVRTALSSRKRGGSPLRSAFVNRRVSSRGGRRNGVAPAFREQTSPGLSLRFPRVTADLWPRQSRPRATGAGLCLPVIP